MDEDAALIGSPITLAELKGLGEFVRWQDLGARVADLTAAKVLPNGYPLVASRLPATGIVDLCLGGRWRQVKFLRVEGTRLGGNRRIVYRDEGVEKTTRYDWFGVAPAGHYTEWKGPHPKTLAGAELLDRFELAQQGHIIHSQVLEKEDWPYLTFKVRSFHPDARWVEREDMWTGSYTVHAADPMNVALYNASIQGRQSIVEKFEGELALTDPNDRPLVVSLLKRLAFGESD